jgi:hypothetical protein
MDNIKRLIAEKLDSLNSLIKAHKGFVLLGEVEYNRAVIYCGGQCADCSSKCFESSIQEAVPGIKIIFR